jgi:hypothetical protein
MTQLNQLIEIVFDDKKKKLRARSVQDGRWVKFPNSLRQKNMIYEAEMRKGIGDSWDAVKKTIKPYIVTNEKKPELEELLNIKNKLLLKQFYEVIYNPETNKVNTEMMNIIFLVKKIHPNIDEQILQPLIKKYSHSAFISSDHLIPLENMLKIYNEKRIVSIFSNYEEDDFVEDTVIMYQRLFENDIEISHVMPEKPKNIRELHTIFSRECSKIKVPKNQLKQNLEHINNRQLSAELVLFVPETTHDLISIGNPLSICVGNGYYGEKVLKKQCNIVAVQDKNKKFIYCIEFHRGQIIQARGFRNSNMPMNLQTDFLKLLKEEKQVA